MLHRAVEVAAEAVLDQQRREVEGPQDQLFKRDCVTRNVELFRLATHDFFFNSVADPDQ